MDRLIFWLTELHLASLTDLMRIQPAVIDSWRVSLMPQQRDNFELIGPLSTVPYFTWIKGISYLNAAPTVLLYFLVSSLRDQVLMGLDLDGWYFLPTVLFWLKVNQHNEPRLKLLRATDTIKILPLIETIQPECSLCHWCHHPLLYFSLNHNGPPPMSTLVSAWRRHRSYSCARSLRGACPASL